MRAFNTIKKKKKENVVDVLEQPTLHFYYLVVQIQIHQNPVKTRYSFMFTKTLAIRPKIFIEIVQLASASLCRHISVIYLKLITMKDNAVPYILVVKSQL